MFLQAQQQISDLEEQVDVTVKKTARKVNTLKAQFQEHKSKWEAVSQEILEVHRIMGYLRHNM